MQKKSNWWVFSLVFMLLGLVISIQVRSILLINGQKVSVVKKLEQLKTELNSNKLTEERLNTEIGEKTKKIDEYLKTTAINNDDTEMKKMIKDLYNARVKAGLTDVRGPGVIITLDDAKARTDENPLDIIIHDVDIVSIVNILKIAGAQAIAVNGERIISLSEQICAGTTIRINKKRYTVPFTIQAIGDPAQLERSLIEGKLFAVLLDFKIRIDITKSNDVLIPKFILTNSFDKLISKLEVIEK
jgi:uncharacterized protein YlxW (UPF0749 family)